MPESELTYNVPYIYNAYRYCGSGIFIEVTGHAQNI